MAYLCGNEKIIKQFLIYNIQWLLDNYSENKILEITLDHKKINLRYLEEPAAPITAITWLHLKDEKIGQLFSAFYRKFHNRDKKIITIYVPGTSGKKKLTTEALNLHTSKSARAEKIKTSPLVSALDVDIDMQSQSFHYQKRVEKAMSKIKHIKNMVPLFKYDRNNNPDEHWSMGDTVAGLKIAEKCAEIGIPRQTLIYLLNAQNDIKLHSKLAKCLPAESQFNPQKTVEQTFQKGSSVITICPDDQRLEKTYSVVISFFPPSSMALSVWPLSYPAICLKPYRFYSSTNCIAVRVDNKTHQYPLNLNPNSILSSSDNRDTILSIRNSAVTKTMNDYLIAVLNKTCDACSLNKIHMGVVYGLYHTDILSKNKHSVILTNWLGMVNQYMSSNQADKNPVIIFVYACSRLKVHSFAFTKEQETINLTSSDGPVALKANIKKLANLNALSKRKAIVVLLPSLKNELFEKILIASDLPTLAEGANLTSLLLEHGHPHLSVLPGGNTPVAQNMGNPLEAMKVNALSYTLSASCEEKKILNHVRQAIECENYETALKTIDTTDVSYKNLAYLIPPQKEKPDATPGFKKEQLISVVQLLEKAIALKVQGKKLGKFEKKALIAAVDPGIEAGKEYICGTLNENSEVIHHCELQRMHVSRPFLDGTSQAVIMYDNLRIDQ